MKLKRITYTAALALVGVVAVVGIQLYTVTNASDQARVAAVAAWKESHPSDAEVVARYQRECQNGAAEIPANKIPIRPLTFSECAAKAGSQSLASAIEAADKSIEIPAPLRWL